MQRTLLKLHRWLSLAFSLPLAILILTGIVLAFEPMPNIAPRSAGSLDSAQCGPAFISTRT